jgi:hypothetical protein
MMRMSRVFEMQIKLFHSHTWLSSAFLLMNNCETSSQIHINEESLWRVGELLF